MYCNVWIERDRAMLTLYRDDDTEVFTLTDDEVAEAITDGFLRTPRLPRAKERDWLPCLVAYAVDTHLIPKE